MTKFFQICKSDSNVPVFFIFNGKLLPSKKFKLEKLWSKQTLLYRISIFLHVRSKSKSKIRSQTLQIIYPNRFSKITKNWTTKKTLINIIYLNVSKQMLTLQMITHTFALYLMYKTGLISLWFHFPVKVCRLLGQEIAESDNAGHYKLFPLIHYPF